MKTKKLTLADCTVTVEALEEDHSFVGEYDDEVVEGFRSMVEAHGLWGWSCVRVTVSYGPLSGVDYLGGCSYESEEDFRADSMYFEDMCETALAALQNQVDELAALICQS